MIQYYILLRGKREQVDVLTFATPRNRSVKVQVRSTGEILRIRLSEFVA